MRLVVRLPRPLLWLLLATLLSALSGLALGSFVRRDLPDVRVLEDFVPPQLSLILAADGTPLAREATAKRIVVSGDRIPRNFRLALIASEDSRFAGHRGVDPIGGLRAFVSLLRRDRVRQGASTLTMQLAGNLFLDRSDRSLRRKLQEIFLAFEVERIFTKDEILVMYANQVHFAHGLYGVEAAARHYFGIPASELTLEQSATLVSILPRPTSFSPRRDIDRSRTRRNRVLQRMVEIGQLDAGHAALLQALPVTIVPEESRGESARYFSEHIRRSVIEQYGADALYGGGLRIHTTLDPGLQRAAERAIAEGLAAYGERHDAEGALAQAALVALDPRDGRVLAWVGGRDFAASEYDRVSQAQRQPGSLFKPFVLTAALERGATLGQTILDEPTLFIAGRGAAPYRPENFSRDYHGEITLRTALEKSVNIATVKLMAQTGYDPVIDVARRMGIHSPLRPYPSLALGAFELNLLEITTAYAAFANGGYAVEARCIDAIDDPRSGRTQRQAAKLRDALSPQVAWIMSQALRGVIERGSARSAFDSLPPGLAGKTGTTDNNTDAWFVGFSPSIVAGVWIGFDRPTGLGRGETGSGAALPIWSAFMREALELRPTGIATPPREIVLTAIEAESGLRWAEGCGTRLVESFVAGSEPTAACSGSNRIRLAFPYPFHRYGLTEEGALRVPVDELELLLQSEPTVQREGPHALLLLHPDGALRLALAPQPPATFPGSETPKFDGRAAREQRMPD